MIRDPKRRRTLRGLAAGALAGTAGMTGLLRAALAADTRPGMRSIRGEVSVDGKPAALGQKIQPGQKVVTGPDGEAVFVIGKDAFLQRANSEFAVEQGAGVTVLRYLTGKVLAVFGKGRKTLDTPTAIIGIRGTACYIEAEAEQTYFCLCYGSADVQPKGGPGMRKRVRTRHHEMPMTIGMGRAEPIMQRARVLNHKDDELVMLEALVGRRPPFYGKHYDEY